MRASPRCLIALVFLLVASKDLLAQQPPSEQPEIPRLPPTVVEAESPETTPVAPTTREPTGPMNRGDSLLGVAPSASQGTFGAEDLSTRPLMSPNNVLDAIPGFASTQENTGSDAGVYYIRGVNTEHGTDFAIFLDEMPINMPTHAHAQGLANLNFLIPELIQTVSYRKGSYFADLGDFSTLGAAQFKMYDRLPESIDALGAGQFSWIRGLTASTVEQWNGDLLYAADLSFYDNGWDIPERNKRFKGVIKHTLGDEIEGLTTSLMAYHGDWFSTEAQPISSIMANGRYSNLDPTTGGRETRFSWNTQYWRDDEYGEWKANVFTVFNRFELWINPEQDPAEQVGQPDERFVSGLNVARQFDLDLFALPSPWTFGVQVRDDYINVLRRDHTVQRDIADVEKSHRVNIFKISPYIQNDTQWTDKARTVIGVRSDINRFDVVNRLDSTQNGDEVAAPVMPKFSLILGPWLDTEYFFNLGTGYHSNDARNLFDPLEPADPIARTKSAEVGLRSELFPEWQTTVALWHQEFGSELVFNAEEGEVEALGPSQRYGFETTNRFFIAPWLTWDVDWAWAHIRFTNGDRVPQSLTSLFQTGPTVRAENGLHGSLNFRAFSPRPLIEDGSIFSGSLEVADLQVGWRRGQWEVTCDVFNVFGSRDFAQSFAEAELFVRPLDPTQARFNVVHYY